MKRIGGGSEKSKESKTYFAISLPRSEGIGTFLSYLIVQIIQNLTGPLTNPIAGRESHRIDFRIDQHGAYVCETTINGEIVSRTKEQRGISFLWSS